MRISTSEASQLGINAILNQQSQLLQTQLKLSSGKSILQASDNPSGAALALHLQNGIDATNQYQQNGSAAQTRLNLESTTLTSVTNALQTVRQLVVQANNGTQSNASRQSIAAQIQQNLTQLVSLANTQAPNGEYLFSGTASHTQPYATPASSSSQYTYAGSGNVRQVAISQSANVAMGDAGPSVFSAPAGNGQFSFGASPGNTGTGVLDTGSVTNATNWQKLPANGAISLTYNGSQQWSYSYTDASGAPQSGTATASTGSNGPSTLDISSLGLQLQFTGTPANGDSFKVTKQPSTPQANLLNTVKGIAQELSQSYGSGSSMAQFHTYMNNALGSLDQALNTVNNVQARVGGRLNAISSQNQIQSNWLVQLKSAKSKVQDLNYAQAISTYQRQLTALQAAQKVYTKVQGLSLFNYL